MNKRQLYESIMHNVSHEVKQVLNETNRPARKVLPMNEAANTNFYAVGYIEDSTDGMALYSGFAYFSSYQKALNYIKSQYSEYSYIDCVKGFTYEYNDETGKYDKCEMIDPYNEGRYCVGYVVLMEESLS